LNNSCLCCF